jgi:hypothetical protein
MPFGNIRTLRDAFGSQKPLLEEIEMQSKIVKSKFLLTTAMLLASVSLASAQGMQQGGGAGEGGREHGMTAPTRPGTGAAWRGTTRSDCRGSPAQNAAAPAI